MTYFAPYLHSFYGCLPAEPRQGQVAWFAYLAAKRPQDSLAGSELGAEPGAAASAPLAVETWGAWM